MTENEFNEKYVEYLEPRFYGLAISVPSVVDYLNKEFVELTQIPGFKFSQIKMKFDSARFYCEPRSIDTNKIEAEIKRLVLAYEEEAKTLEVNVFRFGG